MSYNGPIFTLILCLPRSAYRPFSMLDMYVLSIVFHICTIRYCDIATSLNVWLYIMLSTNSFSPCVSIADLALIVFEKHVDTLEMLGNSFTL